MGNCVAVEIHCDEVIKSAFSCLFARGYIGNLKKNLGDLQKEMEVLRATQADVQDRVDEAENTKDQKRLKAVEVWLKNVETAETQFNSLQSDRRDQLKKLCLCGFCSKSVCSSYSYGKKVFLLLEEVRKLKSQGDFPEVAKPTSISVLEVRPTRPTIGQDALLQKAWNRLMEVGVGIMGVYGMGGVGKTTLFEQLNNNFSEISGRFDVVIWTVVSQGAETGKIQDGIAEKLRLCDEKWNQKDQISKATAIHRFLTQKRFVVMLDDIWEKVDLKAVGIPFPTKENGCKVAFTTRSREVCGRMGDHEPLEVQCLGPDEAWELFENKVGYNTVRRDPAILEVAKRVAEKCRGLPLALSVIGETMSYKRSLQEWEHALDVLTTSAIEFSDMENKILPILKYSYESLADEHIQQCFLYCALFPEDHLIEKEMLINYWTCEGFLGEDPDIRKARNKGYEVLGSLICASLLTEEQGISGKANNVKMQDVIREMALWIASDLGKQKESYVVKARAGLLEIPKVKDWGGVRRMSLIENKIEEISCSSKCSKLRTMFLQNNKLNGLPGEFIRSMQQLLVLDLSYNYNFSQLPEQISEVASLRYLNLSKTLIKKLPAGLQELKELIHLNLDGTSRLLTIDGISKLTSLKILRLLDSGVCEDINLVKELKLLENLSVLTITISAESVEQLLGDQKLANCTQDLHICHKYTSTTGRTLSDLKSKTLLLPQSMESLQNLHLESVVVGEINFYTKTCPSYPKLSTVRIEGCFLLTDMTWVLCAPNVVSQGISGSSNVKEIINKEKANSFTSIGTPFQKLEHLRLDDLPMLTSIYCSPLPFPCLRTINLSKTHQLRKLPLNVNSVPHGNIKIDYVHWVGWDHGRFHDPPYEFTWEDEETKSRFRPCFEDRFEFDSNL